MPTAAVFLFVTRGHPCVENLHPQWTMFTDSFLPKHLYVLRSTGICTVITMFLQTTLGSIAGVMGVAGAATRKFIEQ